MMRETTRGTTPAFARAAVAALAVSVAVLAAACGASVSVTRQTPPPVRIGAIYNLTGGQAPLDAPSLDGARLAVDRINAHGGLLGRRVELLERDGQTDEREVRLAAAGLAASGCTVIIGLSDTGQVLAAAPIAARAGVPFVTSGATSPLLPGEVPEWLFLACFGDNAQAAASAQYATDRLGARTAAVLYDKDQEYTRLLARYFERSFRAQGGNVVTSVEYSDARKAAERLEDAGESRTADVLFVPAMPADAAQVVRELRAEGYRQPVMGGDSYDSSELVKAAEETGGKVYYTTHAAVGMTSASLSTRRFCDLYESAYGRPPQNAFAALGYDTVGLAASAIRRADSVDPQKVREALQATRHFPGVTGTLSYQADGRVPRKKVTVVCVGRRPIVVAQFTPGYVAEP